MQKNLPQRLSALFMTAAMAGCTTLQFDPHTCKVNESTRVPVVPLVLSVNTTSGDVFSNSCDEGKAGASATLNARLPDGKINPLSAYVGKKFVEGFTADSEVPEKKDYAQSVLYYYHSFLQILGHVKYEEVLKVLEFNKAEAATSAPDQTPKTCTGKGAVMICAAPAAAASSPAPAAQ